MFAKRSLLLWAGTSATILVAASAVAAKSWNAWGSPEKVAGVNTDFNDGCPIISPYDGNLYMASNRPNGRGGLDIWIAPRSGDGWGTPYNPGAPINTAADEFCPTPARGNRFFFVRRIDSVNTDIFVVKKLPHDRWGTPEPLPSTGTNPINSGAEEWSPSVYETTDGDEVLYFASTRKNPNAPQPRWQSIYYSVNFGSAQLVNGDASSPVNSTMSDARPNVSRDGLELVWDSNRTGPTSVGGADIWSAQRASVNQPWGPAVNLGPVINSSANETRPSFSWDGTTLMFGSGRNPSAPTDIANIYRSKRTKATGRTR